MIEKIKQARDNNNVFDVALTDLSKAFDCINHKLLIPKLNVYDFDSPSLKFMSVYLNFRKQNTKVGSTFGDYLNILFGVPQGSINRPLFSMFILAISFSKLTLLSSLAMQIIIPLLLPRRTTKN